MNTSNRSIAALFLALDTVAVLVVFNLVRALRMGALPERLIIGPLVVPALALIFALYLIDGYNARTDLLGVEYASQHAIATIGAMAATAMVTYVLNADGYELQSSRLVIAASFALLLPLGLSYRRYLYLRTAVKRGENTLVFLGDGASCQQFREECRHMGTTQRIIFSVVSEASMPPFAAPGPEALRPFHLVLDDVEQRAITVEAIVLRETARELPPDVARRLVQLYFAGVPTYTLELFHQVYWRKIPLYRLNQTWLFQEGFPIARDPVFERLKRAADVLLAGLGLLVSAPVIGAACFAVWLEDRGPPFFRQARVGKNHAKFRIAKIRTMRPTTTDALYTEEGDTRVTRVGRFLRATRLDEFPQLWNVLRGDMSLIGPRAEWDRLVDRYEREIPCYHFRHLVKPGVTGWAQINYPYGASVDDTLRKLEYDLYYIRHFSFRLDASIVLKTIHVMLFGKGR